MTVTSTARLCHPWLWSATLSPTRAALGSNEVAPLFELFLPIPTSIEEALPVAKLPPPPSSNIPLPRRLTVTTEPPIWCARAPRSYSMTPHHQIPHQLARILLFPTVDALCRRRDSSSECHPLTTILRFHRASSAPLCPGAIGASGPIVDHHNPAFLPSTAIVKVNSTASPSPRCLLGSTSSPPCPRGLPPPH
jgi:hypothetical protein